MFFTLRFSLFSYFVNSLLYGIFFFFCIAYCTYFFYNSHLNWSFLSFPCIVFFCNPIFFSFYLHTLPYLLILHSHYFAIFPLSIFLLYFLLFLKSTHLCILIICSCCWTATANIDEGGRVVFDCILCFLFHFHFPAIFFSFFVIFSSLWIYFCIISKQIEGHQAKVFNWIIGGTIDRVDNHIMFIFWVVSGTAIYNMYMEVVTGMICVGRPRRKHFY